MGVYYFRITFPGGIISVFIFISGVREDEISLAPAFIVIGKPFFPSINAPLALSFFSSFSIYSMLIY
jgi:hypothetical protein